MSGLIKRLFDFVASLFGLLILCPVILAAWLLSSIETRGNGFFLQTRIGRYGRPFKTIKIKTMYADLSGKRTSISTSNMDNITFFGRFMRKYKIDELPQLWNVFIGEMSFVGPRPDVPGYADKLKGEEKLILKLRPGITGPASIFYRNEEYILSTVADPRRYNDEVIWPNKVRINLEYYYRRTFFLDMFYIYKTFHFGNH